jgi:UDP-N-acetylglucosamine--N-acetylmuramyl-(pentapeptide) pyrophosphoryl-undecaprenol N-acetylglucosamine transferase
VVPEGLGMLHSSLRLRLQVMQQCRPDDIEAVRARYAELGIPAELMTYIDDMPGRLAEAHLIIGRAGASTIAELTAAGRPAILIPYPYATDDHQTEVMAQDPQALINAATRALSVGRPHAARDLADLLERVGGGLAPLEVGPVLTPRTRAVPAGGVPA